MATYNSIAEYLYLYEDEDAPPIPKPSLQQYDNYQIYSLICCDYPADRISIDRKMVSDGRDINSPNGMGGITTQILKTFADYRGTSTTEAAKLIAYQQFSPSPVTIDFSNIASKANVQPPMYRKYRHEVSRTILATFSDTLPPGSPIPPDFKAACDSQPGLNNFIFDNYAFIEDVQFIDFGSVSGGTYGQFKYGRRQTLYQVIYTGAYTPTQQLDMFSLIGGYEGDPRSAPDNYPKIMPTETGSLSISYYRRNPDEPIKFIYSLDWYTYNVDLIKGKSIHLPIVNPVFGSLIIQGETNLVANAKSLLATSTPDLYSWSDYYAENIDRVIDEWKAIQNSFVIPPPPPSGNNIVSLLELSYLPPIQRVLSANNNHWNNDTRTYSDVNFISSHPLFIVNNLRAYFWHVIGQFDGSYGNLVMNSPKLDDVWNALNAGKYGVNSLDPNKPRVTNLGHLVEKIAFLLGYRPDDNGEFSKAVEETRIRKILPADKSVDAKKVGVNNFGDEGMVLSRNINRFNKHDIVDDECVVIQDLIQLISEFQDRDNIAFGIQESSAVEINNANGKSRYNNQLEILIDLVNLVKDSNDMIRSTMVSSLVTQGQTSEIIGGLGLPSVTKTLPVSIDGNDKEIPYKGIAPHRSISQEIATCTYNIGIVTGHLL